MRAAIILALAALPLAACEMSGVAANSALKQHQGGSAADLEKAIAQRFSGDPDLTRMKASVAISNLIRDGFQTRTSVLLAGFIPSEDTRPKAAQAVKDAIGGEPDDIAILDLSRVKAP